MGAINERSIRAIDTMLNEVQHILALRVHVGCLNIPSPSAGNSPVTKNRSEKGKSYALETGFKRRYRNKVCHTTTIPSGKVNLNYLSIHPSIGTILYAERWCCLSSLLGYWAQSWMGHHSITGYQASWYSFLPTSEG